MHLRFHQLSHARRSAAALAMLGLAATGGCAADLGDQLTPGADAGVVAPVVNQEQGDGITTTVVAANDQDAWIYLDLESGSAVVPNAPDDAPADLLEWDLGFQRQRIKINGGISGQGNAAVALVSDTGFDALTRAPAAAYIADEPDQDDNGEPEYAMSSGDNAWYDYDVTTHVLTPKDVVYVIRSVEGNHYKLAMQSYYDDAGTSGFPSFLWAAVDSPVP